MNPNEIEYPDELEYVTFEMPKCPYCGECWCKYWLWQQQMSGPEEAVRRTVNWHVQNERHQREKSGTDQSA